MTVYSAFALIAAIPAALALILLIFAWAWQLVYPRIKKRSEPSEIVRSNGGNKQNQDSHVALPSAASSRTPSLLEDIALLPLTDKPGRRDKRIAQQKAAFLIQGEPDKTILFAAHSLQKRSLRWNALLQEVAQLPISLHQQQWVEKQILITMKEIEQSIKLGEHDKKRLFQNASQIVVQGTLYFNALKEPDQARDRAKNWYNMGRAYSCVADLSRKSVSIYQRAELNCYQHALEIYTTINDSSVEPDRARLKDLIGKLPHPMQMQHI